jgi:hypothetical protein
MRHDRLGSGSYTFVSDGSSYFGTCPSLTLSGVRTSQVQVRFQFNGPFLVATLNAVFLILFDTLVVGVTLYNTLGLVRTSRKHLMLPRKPLTQIVAEQGRLVDP